MAGLLPIPPALNGSAGQALPAPAGSNQCELRSTVQWLASEVVTVISSEGEVDATNADTFLNFILGEVLLCRGLVLDLAGVTFFNSDGYRSLDTLAARCATADVSWVLIPSSQVRRVLRICDVAQQLPVAESVAQGLAAVSGLSPHQRRLGGSAACNPRWVSKGRVVVASGD